LSAFFCGCYISRSEARKAKGKGKATEKGRESPGGKRKTADSQRHQQSKPFGTASGVTMVPKLRRKETTSAGTDAQVSPDLVDALDLSLRHSWQF